MKTRVVMILAATLLLSGASGCSGMKNFLFGRGAACGSCLSLPKLPGLGGRPLGSCLGGGGGCLGGGSTCGVPVAPPVTYGAAPVVSAPVVSAPIYGGAVCGTCNAAPQTSCGCSSSYSPPIASDPYLSSPPISGSIPSSGQIIHSDPVIGPSYNSGVQYGMASPIYGGSDNFQSRTHDTDGARIISESPLPPGAIPATPSL